ncbi:ORF6C domain-containing protein [Latilactobacillus sp. 5-91]|uniref:ORF6C domain-containing protein n=1 Tax=Latilactobacillus sp. 5-91 TaxID=3410924 RepID=UPI003C711F27
MSTEIIIPSETLPPAKRQSLFMEQVQQQMELQDNRIRVLEDEQPLYPFQNKLLNKKRRSKVIEILGGKKATAYRTKPVARKVFKLIAEEYKQRFKVDIFAETNRKDYHKAIAFYDQWMPNFDFSDEIRRLNKGVK